MTTQANTYTVLAGPSSFWRSDFDLPRFYSKNFTRYVDHSQLTQPYEIMDVARDFHTRTWDTNAFEILDASRCAQEYNRQYVSSWGDLFLELSPRVMYLIQTQCPGYYEYRGQRKCNDVIDEEGLVVEWDDRAMAWSTPKWSNLSEHTWVDLSGPDSNTTTLSASSDPSIYPSYQWLGREISMWLQRNSESKKISFKLTPFRGSEVNCRAEKVPETCTLNFNFSFALVVVAFNFIKLITMSLTLCLQRTPTLVTTGDAINSFLTQADETTLGRCLFSGASMYLHWKWGMDNSAELQQVNKFKQQWLDGLTSSVYKPERLFWGQSVSSMRWTMCFLLYAFHTPYFHTMNNTLQIRPHLSSRHSIFHPVRGTRRQIYPRRRRPSR